MKKIVIVNDGLGPNKGDQAILLSMLDSLKESIPKAQIKVFPNSKMTRISQYLEFWKDLKNADLFIFGGGQEVQDHASIAFLISGLLKIFLAKILSTPVYCYAIGVGPVATILGKLLTRLVLNRVDVITLRDKDSKNFLNYLNVTKPEIFITADPTFTLSPAKKIFAKNIFSLEKIDEKHNGPRIAIVPRRWFHYKHYLLPMSLRSKYFSLGGQREFTNLKKIIAQVADYLISTNKAKVIFIPMRSAGNEVDPGQDDDLVSKEIINLMKFKKNVFQLKGNYSPKELKTLLGQMDLVIGMRMHSLIMSSTMGVPVIGIDILPKFKPFFEMIGQETYLINVKELNSKILLDKITSALSYREQIRKELKVRIKTLQKKALMDTDFILKLLSKV